MNITDCERWISMEEVRTEGDQGQPIIPSSLLQVLHGSNLPCQKEGTEMHAGQVNPCGNI